MWYSLVGFSNWNRLFFPPKIFFYSFYRLLVFMIFWSVIRQKIGRSTKKHFSCFSAGIANSDEHEDRFFLTTMHFFHSLYVYGTDLFRCVSFFSFSFVGLRLSKLIYLSFTIITERPANKNIRGKKNWKTDLKINCEIKQKTKCTSNIQQRFVCITQYGTREWEQLCITISCAWVLLEKKNRFFFLLSTF